MPTSHQLLFHCFLDSPPSQKEQKTWLCMCSHQCEVSSMTGETERPIFLYFCLIYLPEPVAGQQGKARRRKLCKISLCVENKEQFLLGTTMEFRLSWVLGTEKEIGNAGETSAPQLFALVPGMQIGNQNQLLRGLNCEKLDIVRGGCELKAAENSFSPTQ